KVPNMYFLKYRWQFFSVTYSYLKSSSRLFCIHLIVAFNHSPFKILLSVSINIVLNFSRSSPVKGFGPFVFFPALRAWALRLRDCNSLSMFSFEYEKPL